MDKRLSKLGCFQAARVACENAFPRSRRVGDNVVESTRSKSRGRSSTQVGRNNGPMSHYSMSRLSPVLAAAMLSLPWPPPGEKGRLNDPEDDDKSMNISAESSSRKLVRKKYNRRIPTFSREPEEDRNYIPFRIPRFHEVHTSWPGFEHEPIPNWQHKYMLAKPYPRNYEELPPPPDTILSQPSYTILANMNNNESPETRSNFQSAIAFNESTSRRGKPGERSSSSTRGTKKTTMPSNEGRRSKPRARLHVEHLGKVV